MRYATMGVVLAVIVLWSNGANRALAQQNGQMSGRQAEVVLDDGRTVSGSLAGLGKEGLILRTDEGLTVIPLAKIDRIVFAPEDQKVWATIRVAPS